MLENRPFGMLNYCVQWDLKFDHLKSRLLKVGSQMVRVSNGQALAIAIAIQWDLKSHHSNQNLNILAGFQMVFGKIKSIHSDF